MSAPPRGGAIRPTLHDVGAGISVALLLIPQAMAYAELAGLPPQVGLFAAALPPLLAAPFASSPYLQTGPVALTALLTFGALEGLAAPSTPEYVALAALLALLVGICRAVLGLLRMGRIAYLLSNPALLGFTSGAAILIVASQLPGALGFDAGDDGVLPGAFRSLISPDEWRAVTIGFAVFTSAVMIAGRKIHTLFPSVLLAVLLSTVASKVFGFSGARIGDLPGGFLDLRIDFPWGSTGDLALAAIAIALVGFAEPSSIGRSFATADRQPWDANREMLGQGVANIAAGFSGGLPVGGSFSRSALCRSAGARTHWSGAVAGLFVLLTLPLTPLLAPLPRATLAALVITSTIKLVDVRQLWRLIGQSPAQAVVAFGTLAATLLLSPRIERAVVVGAVLAIGVHLYRELTVTVDHRISGTAMTVYPQGVLWFATVPQIEGIVRKSLADNGEVDEVVFDLAGVGRLDYTGAATLEQVVSTLTNSGIDVRVVNVSPGAARAANIHLGDAMGAPPSPDASPSS